MEHFTKKEVFCLVRSSFYQGLANLLQRLDDVAVDNAVGATVDGCRRLVDDKEFRTGAFREGGIPVGGRDLQRRPQNEKAAAGCGQFLRFFQGVFGEVFAEKDHVGPKRIPAVGTVGPFQEHFTVLTPATV